MMIFGASEVSRNVDLGYETTTMMCKFVVRASDASITKQIESDPQGWLDDLTDGGVEYMPEDEMKVADVKRLRISMEQIAADSLAKSSPQPPPKTPKSDDDEEEDEEEEGEDEDKKKKKKEKKENGKEDGEPKGPSTLSKLTAEEVEHLALRAVVLQEWHMLCKDRSTNVN